MPYETGGRADKFGNRYEGRWVVKQLLRLIKRKYHLLFWKVLEKRKRALIYGLETMMEVKYARNARGEMQAKSIGL